MQKTYFTVQVVNWTESCFDIGLDGVWLRGQDRGSVNVDHEDVLSGLWHFGKGEGPR